MNRSHIEKYKSEMMKLYGQRTQDSAADIAQERLYTDDPPISADESVYEDVHGDNEADDIEQAYPDPDLSELDIDSGQLENESSTPPEYSSEEALGDCIGYILANVRAGDESSPVEGAAVSVTAIVDGQRMLIASALTDENGSTRKMEVPVPDAIHSQSPSPSVRPYSLYDVTVTADGYFNARSVDVPVFSGITSIQNFNMIPVPLMTSPSSETQTYYNREPFPSDGEE